MSSLCIVRMVVLLLVSLLSAGCTQAETPAPAEARESPAQDLRARCLSAVPEDAPIRSEGGVTGPGMRMPVAVIGPERTTTVMVLMHQINAAACGWGRFATAAAERGITSVIPDLCGYGASDCTERGNRDIVAQVRLLLDHARSLGGDRLVLVGASMGGSQTVRAVAAGVPVDGWVDVSGPSGWQGVTLLDLARSVPTGGLVVHARSDGPASYSSARRLAARTHSDFVDGGHGHGYELLTTYTGRLRRGGRAVLDYVDH